MRRRPYRNLKKDEKRLLKLGWTTDKVWWYNPRSQIRYTLQVAVDLEDLRRMKIKI